jgi:hypothetical protein
MLTAMTEEDWTIVLRVFAASRSRRGDTKSRAAVRDGEVTQAAQTGQQPLLTLSVPCLGRVAYGRLAERRAAVDVSAARPPRVRNAAA